MPITSTVPGRVLGANRANALLGVAITRPVLAKGGSAVVLTERKTPALVNRGSPAVGAVRQNYKGGAQPSAIPGYTLIWFEDAGTPDDYYMNVIE